MSSSSSDARSTPLSHNTYGYNAAGGDQEVNQPVGNNDQNEDPHHQPAPANEQNVIPPPDPRRHIGSIICKEFNGTRYLGKVVGYNDERQWFRVEYKEEEFEDMDEETIVGLMAKQSDIVAAQAQASGCVCVCVYVSTLILLL